MNLSSTSLIHASMLDGDCDFRKAGVANAEPPRKDLAPQHEGILLEQIGGQGIEQLLDALLEDHEDGSITGSESTSRWVLDSVDPVR